MTSPHDRCETCRFWFEHGPVGECRRYPPMTHQALVVPEPETEEIGGLGVWPWTLPGHWCGEYQSEPEP